VADPTCGTTLSDAVLGVHSCRTGTAGCIREGTTPERGRGVYCKKYKGKIGKLSDVSL